MPQLPLIDLAAEGITYRQFYYRDGDNPTEENFGSDSPATARRVFLVTPWNKRHIFCRWMLGEVAVNYDVSPHELTRTPPQRHPLFLSLWASRVASMKGFKPAPTKPAAGAGNRTYSITDYTQTGTPVPTNYTLAEYESAIVEVEYTHPRYNIAGDGEFIARGLQYEYQCYTEMLDPSASADYVTLPGMALKYAAEDLLRPHGITIPYGVGKVLPLEEFTLVWHRIPYEVYQDGGLDGACRSALHRRIYGDVGETTCNSGSGLATGSNPYLGTVNRFPIFGRPAETLLFTGVQPVRRFGPIPTTWEWDLHYTFSFDPFRWNWKYYHDLGGPKSGWYFASKSGTVPPIVVDPDFGPYYDTPDDDALYNTRNHADLFMIGE